MGPWETGEAGGPAAMATLERPKLRPVSARRADRGGQALLALEDPLGVAEPVAFPLDGTVHRVVRHFDGLATQAEIRGRVRRDSGLEVSAAELAALVERLDRVLLLDGPAFQAHRAAYRALDVRPAALAGRSYPAAEPALRAQLARHFADPRGSGLPAEAGEVPAAPVRAVFSPHIDFTRGGPTYTWAYRALAERTEAQTFVILGVAHQPCARRFALTRKDFQTPLGRARTDRAFVDRLAEHAGDHFFDDELAHRTEHSIEFQVVFLQYLLGGRRDFTIVPILAGSFHDLLGTGADPIADPEIRRFVEALRLAEAAGGRKVAYVGGIDLGHVGPEFGDAGPADDAMLGDLGRFDRALLGHAAAGDPAGWFAEAAAAGDRWRTCGLAAAYTLLHAVGPARGTLLRYDQTVDPERTCAVSFASMAFESVSP